MLRWLPRGTHQWDKFVTPNELELAFERAGLQVTGERGVIYNPFADRWQLSSDTDVNYMLVGERPNKEGEDLMILELVEFNSPKGWSRQQVAEEARNVIPKWQANKELLRKHFLLELDGKTGAGVYIWPSVEAAQKAHDEAWRQSVIKRTGGAPTIRYFDLFLLIDNEKGTVTEFPEAAEIHDRRGVAHTVRHCRA